MTFTEMISACAPSACPKSGVTIGQALEKCLARAVAAQRVTVGVQECAKLLGCAPERVMLCLIPDLTGSPDVGLHIQHTLVRSFCWENDIRLLAVKDTDKLRSLCVAASLRKGAACGKTLNGSKSLQQHQGELLGASQPLPNPAAVSCLLIEMPPEAELSSDEKFVCNYHDTIVYSDVYPKPVIQLPG